MVVRVESGFDGAGVSGEGLRFSRGPVEVVNANDLLVAPRQKTSPFVVRKRHGFHDVFVLECLGKGRGRKIKRGRESERK